MRSYPETASGPAAIAAAEAIAKLSGDVGPAECLGEAEAALAAATPVIERRVRRDVINEIAAAVDRPFSGLTAETAQWLAGMIANPSDPADSNPAEGLPEERLEQIRARFRLVIDHPKQQETLRCIDMYDLLQEVDRLRARAAVTAKTCGNCGRAIGHVNPDGETIPDCQPGTAPHPEPAQLAAIRNRVRIERRLQPDAVANNVLGPALMIARADREQLLHALDEEIAFNSASSNPDGPRLAYLDALATAVHILGHFPFNGSAQLQTQRRLLKSLAAEIDTLPRAPAGDRAPAFPTT